MQCSRFYFFFVSLMQLYWHRTYDKMANIQARNGHRNGHCENGLKE